MGQGSHLGMIRHRFGVDLVRSLELLNLGTSQVLRGASGEDDDAVAGVVTRANSSSCTKLLGFLVEHSVDLFGAPKQRGGAAVFAALVVVGVGRGRLGWGIILRIGLGPGPTETRAARQSGPTQRWTKTLATPLLDGPTRLVAGDMKATTKPFAEIDGDRAWALACAPRPSSTDSWK